MAHRHQPEGRRPDVRSLLLRDGEARVSVDRLDVTAPGAFRKPRRRIAGSCFPRRTSISTSEASPLLSAESEHEPTSAFANSPATKRTIPSATFEWSRIGLQACSLSPDLESSAAPQPAAGFSRAPACLEMRSALADPGLIGDGAPARACNGQSSLAASLVFSWKDEGSLAQPRTGFRPQHRAGRGPRQLEYSPQCG